MSWRARVAGAAVPAAIAGIEPIDERIPKRVWLERP